MVTFTRMNNGDILPASKINELQAAIETLDLNTTVGDLTDNLRFAQIELDVDSRAPNFPLTSGTYASTFTHGFGLAGSMLSLTLTPDRFVLNPISFGKDTVVDLIGCYVGTAVASSAVRLGIFSYDWPTRTATPLLDAGNLNTTTTGAKGITISFTFLAGVTYYLGCVVNLAGVVIQAGATSRGFGQSNNGSIYGSLANASVPFGAYTGPIIVSQYSSSFAPCIYVRGV